MQAETSFLILFTKRQNVKTISTPSYCLKFLGLKKYPSRDNIPLTLAKTDIRGTSYLVSIKCSNTVQYQPNLYRIIPVPGTLIPVPDRFRHRHIFPSAAGLTGCHLKN
jgi:hypothetical protein